MLNNCCFLFQPTKLLLFFDYAKQLHKHLEIINFFIANQKSAPSHLPITSRLPPGYLPITSRL